MPAEQRVITLGFVTVGLVIAVILYTTIGGGESVTDTLDQIKGELYLRYQKAEQGRNYNDWRQTARDIVAALEAGRRKTIESNLEAEATGTNRDVRRLYELIKDGTIDRVAKGEYPYAGKFYPQAVHGALAELEWVVAGEFKTLSRARRLAASMAEALELVRAGSGQPVPTPAPLDLGDDTNPLLAYDAGQFAVFTLDPELVRAALQSKNPGGGANPRRIRWNQEKPGGPIAEELLALRLELADVSQVIARFRAANKLVQDYTDGPADAAKIYAKACDRLAAGVPSAVRAEFDKGRATYEKGDVIARMMELEEKLLREGSGRWEALAKAFQLTFPD